MRIILVGAGFWGAGWAQAVCESRDAELVAIADLDERARTIAADSVGLDVDRRYPSLYAALGDGAGADTALIVVPPEHHAAVAATALEGGLHCLVEKPFAPTMKEARDLVRCAADAGRELMVTQSFRFKRGPQTVKHLIERGTIGDIEAVYVRFMNAPPFTGFRTEMAEPLIVDMAIHHFDFIRGVLGLEPSTVWASSFNPSWSRFQGNASAVAKFATPEGATVVYTGSWSSRGPATSWDGDWDIQGTRGALKWSKNRVRFFPSEFGDAVFYRGALQRGGDVLDIPLVKLASEERLGTLAEFSSALAEGRRPQAHGEDNLRTLALVLGAVESASTGNLVDLREAPYRTGS